MALRDTVSQIRENILRGGFQNEASVSQGIVLRILNELGWDVFNNQTVCPEYSLSGRRVDFALCHPSNQPVVFVEVKQIGKADGADKQLFEYAFHEGIPLAILTDGQVWNFFVPSGQGSYSDRRVYLLDILARTSEECAERFERYLSFSGMVSGDCLNNATEDYRSSSRQRRARESLPIAWQALLQEPDELLVDILASKVESVTGFAPDKDNVVDFLRNFLVTNAGGSSTVVPKLSAIRVSDSEAAINNPPPKLEQKFAPEPGARLPGIGYKYQGSWHPHRNGIDAMIDILRLFAQENRDFLGRFASREHGRSRRWVARNKSDLYQRADLVEDYSRELVPGWWVGTNYSAAHDMPKIVKTACEVMGIKFGQDLIAKFR